MKNLYFGTKQIIATAMTRLTYDQYRGWELPSDENGDDAGYLVEYVDGGASNHPDHAGYISWSPSDVFDRAYQESGSMSFGHAIEAMKLGRKVARNGWNGKGMWAALTPGSAFDARYAKEGHASKLRADELQSNLPHDGSENVIELLPHIDMRAADGSMVVGWLPSQTEMLSNDWAVIS